jgi:1,4-alpha-glucan branching enzyme
MAVGNGKKRITFTVEAPTAGEVYLAGVFNDWDITRTPMKADGKGAWKAIVMLTPGVYEYRVVADGQWITDPTAPAKPNEFGSTNNLREVAAA